MKQTRMSNPVIQESLVPKRHCMVCQKACEGWYATFGESGTCSAKCMRIQDAKPLYPDHPVEAFIARFNL